jgi:hypothetical protein
VYVPLELAGSHPWKNYGLPERRKTPGVRHILAQNIISGKGKMCFCVFCRHLSLGQMKTLSVQECLEGGGKERADGADHGASPSIYNLETSPITNLRSGIARDGMFCKVELDTIIGTWI